MQETQRNTTVRRLFLVAASLCIGALGWFMLGESENLIAEESSTKAMKKTSDGDTVLARVNGEPITESEAVAEVAGEMLKVERERNDLLNRAVQTTVQNRLIENEAKKRGVSREDLLKAEVEDKVGEVTEADVEAFYEERKAQIRAPKEQVLPQIKGYLEQQGSQEAYQDFVARLEKENKVEYMIEPFRVEVAATGPAKGGPEDAPIQIVEFSDFECPFCVRVNPTLAQVHEEFGDKVRVSFRQFPLDIHANARKAGEASLCAHDQSKFWEMHDAMFADQKNLGVDNLKTIASGIDGVDGEKFAECLDSGKYADQVAKDLAEGAEAGVSGTPAFFINGRFLSGAVPYERFAEIIEEELAR